MFVLIHKETNGSIQDLSFLMFRNMLDQIRYLRIRIYVCVYKVAYLSEHLVGNCILQVLHSM